MTTYADIKPYTSTSFSSTISTYGKAQLESDTNGIHELDSAPIRGVSRTDDGGI